MASTSARASRHLAGAPSEPSPRGPRQASVVRKQPSADDHHGNRGAHHERPAPVVAPRSPYERSCHRGVTIIQSGHRTTTILKVAAAHPRSGGSRKGTPGHRRLHEALRIPEDPQPHSPTYRKNGHDHQQLGKPYAHSGKNARRGDPKGFTEGNGKGQLSWSFTTSG